MEDEDGSYAQPGILESPRQSYRMSGRNSLEYFHMYKLDLNTRFVGHCQGMNPILCESNKVCTGQRSLIMGMVSYPHRSLG